MCRVCHVTFVPDHILDILRDLRCVGRAPAIRGATGYCSVGGGGGGGGGVCGSVDGSAVVVAVTILCHTTCVVALVIDHPY